MQSSLLEVPIGRIESVERTAAGSPHHLIASLAGCD